MQVWLDEFAVLNEMDLCCEDRNRQKTKDKKCLEVIYKNLSNPCMYEEKMLHQIWW